MAEGLSLVQFLTFQCHAKATFNAAQILYLQHETQKTYFASG
jgi:hypothetical protein